MAAASATGDGEQIARFLLCRRAVEVAGEAGASFDALLRQMSEEVGGGGGIIALRADGGFAAYDTEAMGHAWRGGGMDEAAVAGIKTRRRPPVAG